MTTLSRDDRLSEIKFDILEMTTKISIKLKKELSPKIIDELMTIGKDHYETYQTLGWAPVGQAIVYGEERRLGFHLSSQLSGNMERHVKLMKKHKCLDEEMFAATYAYHYLSSLNERLENRQ